MMVQDKPLAEICTLGIGGAAKFYIEVQSVPEMEEALLFCKKEGIPFLTVGKGSNCLFDDRGFNGCIIHNKIGNFSSDAKGNFFVGAGYSFSRLGIQAAREGWSGLEFASGIPASVGGAVFMNAGANGAETKDFLVSVDFIKENGQRITFKKEEIIFRYRYSSFQDYSGAIVSAHFSLIPSMSAREKQLKIIRGRLKTQPLKEKSAGCIFRNPEGLFAGQLIEECGLKGYRCNDAEVSCTHANFLINRGKATAEDFKKLIEHIQKTVKLNANIDLINEVRIIPYDILR